MKLLKKVFFLWVLVNSLTLYAQDNSEIAYSKFPLKLSVGNQVVGFPFENSFSAYNPYFSVGTEWSLNKHLKHKLLLASDLGFIQNNSIGNALAIDISLGYRYIRKSGLYLDTNIGLGWLNQYHPNNIYQQNTSDGTYTKVKDKGRLSSLIGFKIGIGYDLSKKTKYPIAVGINYNPFIQTSYFNVDNFSIMPQSITNILITYKFKKS